MDAFRATLEELKDADLLLHVIDISHPRFEDQMAAVEKILQELDLKRIPLLRVFNKADRVDPETAERFCQVFDAVCVSALHPETFSPLLGRIERKISQLKTAPPESVPSYDTPVSSPVAQTA